MGIECDVYVFIERLNDALEGRAIPWQGEAFSQATVAVRYAVLVHGMGVTLPDKIRGKESIEDKKEGKPLIKAKR